MPHCRRKGGYIPLAVLLIAVVACAVCFAVGEYPGQNAEQAPSEQTVHAPEASDPVAPESPEASTPEPSIEYLSDYQANYSDADGAFRVFATFYEEKVPDGGDDYYTTRIGQSEEYFKRVYIFAVQGNTGELAKEAFLTRVQTAHVEVFDAESGAHLALVPAAKCEDNDAALDASVAFASDSGKLELIWRVVLKNGSELVFRQTMEIVEKDQLVYTPADTAMNTMEELRTLIAGIEAETDLETEVIIHLPAVQYEGTLELNRAFSFYGSESESGMTTFTNTVVCSAPEPYIICFFNTAFEGNGTGTGIEDHCGVFLGGCTLHNWEIAAKTGKTGWIVPAGCIIENNEIGIQYNCRQFWFNNNEFIDDCFGNNGIAIEINQMPRTQTLTFPNTRFYGNDQDIANHAGQPVDFSNAEMV